MCVTNTTYRASNPLSLSTSQVLLNASLPQPPVFPSTVPSVFDTKPTSKRRRAPQKPGKTAKNQERHFVVHNYHDHSLDEEVMEAKPRRGGLAGSFPVKLHTVLSQVEADGFSHIVSWQPHGRCFVIHKPKEFVEHIMPRYVSNFFGVSTRLDTGESSDRLIVVVVFVVAVFNFTHASPFYTHADTFVSPN